MFQMEAEKNDINDLDLSEIIQILNDKIGLVITSGNLPFTIVENAYFRDLLLTCISLKPEKVPPGKWRIPTRQSVSNVIVPRLHEEIEKEKKLLLEDTDSCMQADGWKNSLANRKQLVITLRNLKVHIFNCSRIFLCSFDVSLEREDTDSLAALFTAAAKLAYTKFKTTVVSAITDNDKKIKAGAREARNHKGEKFIVATCNSHSGNSLIKTIVFLNKDFTDKVRKFVDVFKTSKMNALIKQFNGLAVYNWPDTRFCYFRDTCESVYKNLVKDVFTKIYCVEDVQLDPEIVELIGSEDFKHELEETIRNLTPVCKLINSCQKPEKNIADATEDWLTLTLPTHVYDDQIAALIDSGILPAGLAAHLIHHKYRGILLNPNQTEKARLYLEDKLDDIGKAQLKDYIDHINLPDELADNCKDPITYWSRKSFAQPQLSQLCLRLLNIPASTASLEGLFSQWSYIHTDTRNRLSDQTSSILIDLYYMSKHLIDGAWSNTVVKKRKKHVSLD